MAFFFFFINIAKWIPYAWLGLLDTRNFATSMVLLPLAPVGVWVGVVGAGAVIDRSGGTSNLGVPFASLVALSLPTHQPDACPMCAAGDPITAF